MVVWKILSKEDILELIMEEFNIKQARFEHD